MLVVGGYRRVVAALGAHDKTEGMTVEEVMRRDKRFRYMLLARLQSDCEYYLGFGNRSTGRLWAGDGTGKSSG